MMLSKPGEGHLQINALLSIHSFLIQLSVIGSKVTVYDLALKFNDQAYNQIVQRSVIDYKKHEILMGESFQSMIK
jgi:hypothetical protein